MLLEITMPTKPTHLRLSEQELADLDKLAKRYGLTTRTDAVRIAIKLALAAKLDNSPPPPA
jgi:hypothetical protein